MRTYVAGEEIPTRPALVSWPIFALAQIVNCSLIQSRLRTAEQGNALCLARPHRRSRRGPVATRQSVFARRKWLLDTPVRRPQSVLTVQQVRAGGVSAVTTMHDANHCTCLRDAAYFLADDGWIHGRGPWVIKRPRRTPVLNSSACDHLPPGAAVRSAKPLEKHWTSNAPTFAVGLAPQRLLRLSLSISVHRQPGRKVT
jgi:hypothetical protein